FIPPGHGWSILRGPNLLAFGVYLFVGLTTAALSESLRRARDAAERAQQAVKGQAEQLRAASQEAEAVNAQLQSQRDNLQRLNELLQRIIDTIPVMIAMYEPDTEVLRLNPEFERLTGWSTEAARHADLMVECYPDPEYRASVQEYMQSLQPGWRDLRMKTRDGREIETSWANIRLSDETQIGIGIDISQRKWLEDELRRRVEALDEADRQKDQFIAVLAHELRNPLAPIRSAVELLKQVGPPEPRRLRAEAIIERQVIQQARLLDDLLDVSRISRGKIRLRRERLDLVPVVRDAVEDCRSLLEQAGLTLALELPEAPVWVEGDPIRLAQVVHNLLQNSAKFTDPGGAVAVTVGAGCWVLGPGSDRADRMGRTDQASPPAPSTQHPAPPPASRVPASAVITVRDTGIGIEAELLPRLFDTFTQADRSLERTRGGLGLGLALVKGLVELHGGEVAAASEGVGRGAEFRVRLPILDCADKVKDVRPGAVEAEPDPSDSNAVTGNPNPQPRPPASLRRAPTKWVDSPRFAPPPEIQNPKSGARLLIIEDNRDAADSLRDLLELYGCT
ncbi:MAG: ATP-binding protein, partial [Gemmatimonadales bacterium]